MLPVSPLHRARVSFTAAHAAKSLNPPCRAPCRPPLPPSTVCTVESSTEQPGTGGTAPCVLRAGFAVAWGGGGGRGMARGGIVGQYGAVWGYRRGGARCGAALLGGLGRYKMYCTAGMGQCGAAGWCGTNFPAVGAASWKIIEITWKITIIPHLT